LQQGYVSARLRGGRWTGDALARGGNRGNADKKLDEEARTTNHDYLGFITGRVVG
jgi:hypothetical protein